MGSVTVSSETVQQLGADQIAKKPPGFRPLRIVFATIILLAAGAATAAQRAASDKGLADIVFADSFEGEGTRGGTISGQVLFDPDADGDLADGQPRNGVTVYLDANFNGRFDEGERNTLSRAGGLYQFEAVEAGIHHVRQVLEAPNQQTLPAGGVTPALDRLPDEVASYDHAAPGVGDFDVPYGREASEWPGEWDRRDSGPMPRVVSTLDFLLKPIGVRNINFVLGPSFGSELLCLPTDAQVTLRFDEPIIDGPGPDLLVHSLVRGSAGEEVELFVGANPDSLSSVGIYNSQDRVIEVDLAGRGLDGPHYFVRAVGQDIGGSWKGFELVGIEVVNFATPDSRAYIVTVTPDNLSHPDKDFGRFAQDLPPTLTVGLSDDEPATAELRTGEPVTLEVAAFDDVAVSSVDLLANGVTLVLDTSGSAGLDLPAPGELIVEASATDSAGQTVSRTARYTIANADGSSPFDENLAGSGAAGGANAPRARIVTPVPGTSSTDNVEIVASITGDPAPNWVLAYAPLDLVDPANLAADDADYIEIASGSGQVYSAPIGSVPLASQPDGIYFVRLSADNVSGSFARFGQVLAKNVPQEQLRPLVTIDGPVSGSQVSMTVDITGTIQSTRPLTEWRVEFARADLVDSSNVALDDPDWRLLASGTDPIPVSDVIANFDATLLRNNSYVLRVIARNDIGLGWVEPLILEVTGEAKLGRNRLEFDDINVELGGFPLRFTRVYDSLQADIEGELGFGWSLALQDTDIGETVPDTGSLGLFGSTPFRVGTRVYLTAPGGERLAFTFDVEAGNPGALGIPYRPVFEPDPGNYYELTVPDGNQAFLRLKDDGNVYLFSIALPYNPTRYILTDSAGIRYTVHEDRGLLGAEDRNGNTLSFNRDRISHSAGPTLEISRDSSGRVIAVTDPTGSQWTYSYDSAGDLVESTDPDQNVTSYIYSVANPHYLDSVLDPQGRMPRRFEYDPESGRLVAEIDENGNRREVNVDPAGFSGSSTDGRGNITLYNYDARGNLIFIEDPDGNEVSFEYADADNPDLQTRFTDAMGEQWNYQYDDKGRPTRLITPLAAGSVNRFRVDYNAQGDITRFITPDGGSSDFTYDGQGNRLTEQPFAGRAYTFQYGPDGQLTERRVDSAYAVTYGYNEMGFLISETDPAGRSESYGVDERGRILSRSNENGSLDVDYTAAGLLNTQQDTEGSTATLTQNLDGSFTRVDRTGNITRFEQDAEGRPTQITLPEGGQISSSYDADGNPSSVTDPLGNTISYSFNFADQLTGIADALGNAIAFTRDANGNLTELTDRNGRRRTFAWDPNRRLVAERWHDGSGAVIREIVFVYRGSFGLRRVEDTFDGLTYSQVFSGRVPQPTQVDYELPGQEEWRVSYGWNGEAAGPRRVQVGIRAAQQASIEANFFGGETLSLTWRHPGSGGSSGNNQVDIVRSPAGHPLQIRRLTGDPDGGGESFSRFTYDSQNRMVSARHEDALGALLHPNGELTYTRDAEGRLLTESHAGNATSYAYDGNGQLLNAQHSAYLSETYSYDVAGNRLTSHLAPAPATIATPNRLASSGDFSYEFDLEGNVTRRTNTSSGRVTEFAYDHRNRLIQASVHPSLGAPASSTLSFEYDYQDRLMWRVVDGVKTWVLHDRNMPVAEFVDGAATLSAAFLYDPLLLDDWYGAWRDDALGERWYLKDQLGSIRGVTDAAFGIVSWVDYDSYGNLQSGSTLPPTENLAYAGRPWLEVLGLYDNRRRFYEPLTGRFTQEDPTVHGGRDHHFYRYAINSPTGFVDPTGEISAVNYQAIVRQLVGIFFMALDSNAPSGVTLPCKIAGWSAGNFGYFDPLAQLIGDPQSASEAPELEPVDLLPLTGCGDGGE